MFKVFKKSSDVSETLAGESHLEEKQNAKTSFAALPGNFVKLLKLKLVLNVEQTPKVKKPKKEGPICPHCGFPSI